MLAGDWARSVALGEENIGTACWKPADAAVDVKGADSGHFRRQDQVEIAGMQQIAKGVGEGAREEPHGPKDNDEKNSIT